MRGLVLAVAGVAAALGSVAPANAAKPDWSGFYAGGHAGVAAGRAPNTSGSGNYWDGLGFFNGQVGAFAGLNTQLDERTVLGVEADATWLGMRNLNFDGSANAYINWMASLDLRAGRLVNPETLLYGKLGWAVINFDVPPTSTFGPWSSDERGAGVTNLAALQAGIGIETHLTRKWRARVEGVYTWATQRYYATPDGEAVTDTFPEILAARVGLSYAFGDRDDSDAAPVKGWGWSGFYLGGSAGWAISDTPHKYLTGPDAGTKWDGFGASHPNAGIFVGLDHETESQKYVFGIEGAATWLGLRNYNGSDSTLYGTVDWSAALDLRAGKLLNPATLLYAKAGGALMGFTSNYFTWPDDPTSAVLPGLQLGVGMETQLNEHWSARVEGLYTVALRGFEYEDSGAKSTLLPNVVSASIGIAYRD